MSTYASVMLEMSAALVLFLFPLAYSPGPGNMFFAANGARFGFQATLAANFGYHTATWLVTLAIGLGFEWFATEFPIFLVAAKYLGSAYVLYLAWRLVNAGGPGDDLVAHHAGFVDGVILLLLNPKAYLIIALVFSQFTGASGEASASQIIFIVTIFTLNNFIAFSIWAFAGDRLASFFRAEAQARQLNIVFGGMLAAVSTWMLFA